ncbi:hypothetical protein BDV38DRAFT_240695 [Aspergillus pseudotamarii]|uniref:Uncharacterized protein n=1 Tax=Aspergillus pseudotamarii TaxID=132259 RepID=A0A5N6SZ54_ASPPS|nr:uncharacterized protein BDV38DRAFT_240695 [Aspergillus pseudotamarii]KAE8139966.1 hypothetical protein BDV38DRAFT_240695 [Aspergillus pseudotamarii]
MTLPFPSTSPSAALTDPMPFHPLGGSTGSRRRGPPERCLLLFFASTLASRLLHLDWVLRVFLRIIFAFVIILDLS